MKDAHWIWLGAAIGAATISVALAYDIGRRSAPRAEGSAVPTRELTQVEQIQITWMTYDKVGDLRTATLVAAKQLADEQAAGSTALLERNRVELRRRIPATLATSIGERSSPPYATGVDYTILVPSDDQLKCTIWGAMWRRDSGLELASMGFSGVRCRDKYWELP